MEHLAAEGAPILGLAVRVCALDPGDALAPVSAEAERGGGAGDEGEAKRAEKGGMALLVGGLEGGEALTEKPSQWIKPAGTVVGSGA
jgi:hypothetical protein